MTTEVIFISLIAPVLVSIITYLAKKYFDGMEERREKKEQERTKELAGPLNEKLDSLTKEVTDLRNDVQYVDLQGTKNYLVPTLARIERGECLTDTEIERLVEQYDHYIRHGGNSYVKAKYEKLKEQGKIM